MGRPRKEHGQQDEPAQKAGPPEAKKDKTGALIDVLLEHFEAEYGENSAGIVANLKALLG